MTFETWWQETYLESGIYTEKYWLGEKDAAKKAWNAALEEAAKVNERLAEMAEMGAGEYPWGQRSSQAARMIRSLKEE